MIIDLNCDAGESFGAWAIGDDRALLPLVTSVNVACGWHAGDPTVLRRTVELAQQHGVAVGAHPGYPDLQGFGRRAMGLSPAEVEDGVLYQIGAVSAFTRAAGVDLVHVKPHGALYNQAARDRSLAEAIARSVHAFDHRLVLVGLAGSALVEAGRDAGLRVAREAFADRAYEPDGSLRSRRLDGAVLHAVDQVVAQALEIACRRRARSSGGSWVTVEADTICLHGDTPGAIEFARAVRAGLAGAGVALRPLSEVVAR